MKPKRITMLPVNIAIVCILLAMIPTAVSADEPELSDILEKISGQWVDEAYYISPVIDRSVVYPFWVIINGYGVQVVYFHEEIRPLRHGGTGTPPVSTPLIIHSVQDGIVELKYGIGPQAVAWYEDDEYNTSEQYQWWEETYFANERADHRIVVDTNSIEIDEISYYIGDDAYTLTHFDYSLNPRYQIEAVNDDIRIAWHGHYFPMRTPEMTESIRIYRSDMKGEKGALIGENDFTQPWDENDPDKFDRFAYEFYDTTVIAGKTYYYSIWVVVNEWIASENEQKAVERPDPLTFGDEWQIEADVNALRAAAGIDVPPDNETEHSAQPETPSEETQRDLTGVIVQKVIEIASENWPPDKEDFDVISTRVNEVSIISDGKAVVDERYFDSLTDGEYRMRVVFTDDTTIEVDFTVIDGVISENDKALLTGLTNAQLEVWEILVISALVVGIAVLIVIIHMRYKRNYRNVSK